MGTFLRHLDVHNAFTMSTVEELKSLPRYSPITTNQVDDYSKMNLIRRIQPTSDETPPWAGMSFIQPVDSDALHERLKTAYPQCTTLRERKHMAAIDFLKAELHQMQSKSPAFTAAGNSVDYSAFASPRAPSVSSEGLGGRSRQASVAFSQSSVGSTQLSTSVEYTLNDRLSSATPASLLTIKPSIGDVGQHIIFNAADGRPMKPKTKRRMTTAEKNAYKETRKRGACPKCKRQKGKCTHAIDTAEDSGHMEEMKRTSKRALSRDTSLSHTEPNKTAKLENAQNAHHFTPDQSQQKSPPFAESLIVGTVGDASSQPNIESGDMQWGQNSKKADRTEIPGYVHHQIPMEPFAISLPHNTGSEWAHYTATTGVHAFNPVFFECVEAPTQPERGYTLPPSHDDPPPDFSFSLDYPRQEPWTENQEPRPRNANPG